jgi:hypothetical protein
MFLKSKGFASFVILGSVCTAYLFASAPAPLPEANAQETAEVSVQQLMEICAAENASVRGLYTKEIVGKGKQAGLKFAEDWHQPQVDAGPLPALFLRETAKSLERDPVRLGLFLGSDHPISKANLFRGRQAEVFRTMRNDRKARHFFVEDLGVYTAMFPDLAVAPACVSCHNEHPDTPKKNWKLDDLMGATTWTYPKATLSLGEALQVIAALRRGFSAAYEGYVEKAKTFKNPPSIGDQWPTNGYFLPTPQVFMREAERRTSAGSMRRLLAAR